MTLARLFKCSIIILIALGSFDSYAVVPARYLGAAQSTNFTIASYTKVINSNRLSGANLAKRYIERGLEYGRLFRFQQSVSDFSQAISLQATSPLSYVHRAVAYARLEQYDKAYADFNNALKLDSKNISALRHRAALYYLQEKYQQAAKDFRLYLQYRPKDMYRMLWLHLAESNGNEDNSSIRRYVKNIDLQQWPGALLELYLGDIPLDQLLLALKPILSNWDANHRCEVYFYIAQYHLLNGKKLQAIRYFDQAVKTKAKQQLEYEFAVAYLRRLK